MAFVSVNWLSILVAAVAAWLFGAVYYGALGKHWVAAQGKTMEQFKQEQASNVGKFSAQLPFILTFVAELVMAWGLYGILVHLKTFSLRAGLISAAFCWLGFVLTTMAANNAFLGRRWTLTAIDAGGWLGAMLLMGAIIGMMGS